MRIDDRLGGELCGFICRLENGGNSRGDPEACDASRRTNREWPEEYVNECENSPISISTLLFNGTTPRLEVVGCESLRSEQQISCFISIQTNKEDYLASLTLICKPFWLHQELLVR